tara:strand:+ start:110 stop:2053 length:1944 start_codon:yes stop_codon:yes gene_type:complete
MYKIIAILLTFFIAFNSHSENLSLSNDSLNNSLSSDSFGSLFDLQESPLSAEEAFDINYNIKSNNLSININIEPEHYLYLHKIKLLVNGKEKKFEFNNYVNKIDEHYGEIKAIYNTFNITVSSEEEINEFEFEYQGCSEKFNICYPMQTIKKKIDNKPKEISKKELTINEEVIVNKKNIVDIESTRKLKKIEEEVNDSILNSKKDSEKTNKINLEFSENNVIEIEKKSFLSNYIDIDEITKNISIDNKLSTFFIFFVAGILISFTPCVLPMIPIISSIVIGNDEKISNLKAFFLSLSYVLGSAFTYAIFGAIAGLFSQNIQIYMQNPYVIGIFSILLFLLALSLFDLYEIKMPSKITNKTTEISNKLKGGKYLTVFLMGILSTLILSPCVAAPLAAGITYIAANSESSGSILFGAFSLFSFGLGIGLVLIIITTLLNTVKIKSGNFMNEIKYFSGFLIIIVSVFIASRIIPDIVTYYLYQIIILSYIISIFARNYEKLKKGFIMIIALLATVLYLNDSNNIDNAVFEKQNKTEVISQKLNYDYVEKLEDISVDKENVLIKFTADWCTYCKKMEKDIFNNQEFYNELSNYKIYVVDLTETSKEEEKIMSKLKVVAPPALFFFKEGKPIHYKIGEVKKSEMKEILEKIK